MNIHVNLFDRVARATDDTTRSWSSISTVEKALWAQALSADRNIVYSHCILLTLPLLLLPLICVVLKAISLAYPLCCTVHLHGAQFHMNESIFVYNSNGLIN